MCAPRDMTRAPPADASVHESTGHLLVADVKQREQAKHCASTASCSCCTRYSSAPRTTRRSRPSEPSPCARTYATVEPADAQTRRAQRLVPAPARASADAIGIAPAVLTRTHALVDCVWKQHSVAISYPLQPPEQRCQQCDNTHYITSLVCAICLGARRRSFEQEGGEWPRTTRVVAG